MSPEINNAGRSSGPIPEIQQSNGGSPLNQDVRACRDNPVIHISATEMRGMHMCFRRLELHNDKCMRLSLLAKMFRCQCLIYRTLGTIPTPRKGSRPM